MTLYGSRSLWGHSVHLSQNDLISKMAGYRAKRSEIWDSWTKVINIWGTFELEGLNVILGIIR